MSDDASIKVWLDSPVGYGSMLVIPYIQSQRSFVAGYSVLLVREGGGAGRSEVRLGGSMKLEPGTAYPLGRMAVTRSPNDSCRVEITIQEEGREIASYHFECPS